ncbi:MAG: hypothetical protein WB764_28015, partial [Xanthobacteraceae bacterium]
MDFHTTRNTFAVEATQRATPRAPVSLRICRQTRCIQYADLGMVAKYQSKAKYQPRPIKVAGA